MKLISVLLILASCGTVARAQLQPSGRACHSAVATRTGILVWGGALACGVSVLSDTNLWLWNGTSWRTLPGPPVVPREDALLLNTGAELSLTLFGGRRDGVVSSDVWRFDGRVWTSISVAGGPGQIQHGASAYDPKRKRVIVFGGATGRSLGRKTYEWDGERWHEFDATGPAPRVGHGMAWSQADGGVLLYGGFAGDEKFRDLWKWDGVRWERLAADGPTFTEGHVIAEADRGVYVVGPGLENATTVRVWLWHMGRFQAAGEAGPPLKVGATATYDRARQILLYWGGSGDAGGPSSSIHEFNGSKWQLRKPE